MRDHRGDGEAGGTEEPHSEDHRNERVRRKPLSGTGRPRLFADLLAGRGALVRAQPIPGPGEREKSQEDQTVEKGRPEEEGAPESVAAQTPTTPERL